MPAKAMSLFLYSMGSCPGISINISNLAAEGREMSAWEKEAVSNDDNIRR
jgi:hypothetical protein